MPGQPGLAPMQAPAGGWRPAPASVFIVIPAYNDGPALRATLEPLIDAGYSIVVVDDGSSDDTWAILGRLPVYSLRHPINLGQGAALQTGMSFALARGAEILIHFDADGQHSADDVPELMDPILAGHADVVLGSRFLRADDARLVPRGRRLLLRCGMIVNAVLTGLWLTDAHNGLRVLTRRAATQIRLRENGFAHASEILAQIRRARLRYVERPTRIVYSSYSRSKGQSAWNALNIVLDLLMGKIFR
jgi:polyprenyl-phospho-N-acetylgalactosaminyl synthase